MTEVHILNELILYAEPGGELGARCADFWAAMSAADTTTSAQEYPPHVTLTGFFHRPPERLPDVLAAFEAALDAAVPAGFDGVRWAAPTALELQANDEWTGLHVDAPWMDAVIAAFVADAAVQVAGSGEDALRPKSWLHVSLAYGEGYDHVARDAAAEAALPFTGLPAEAEWSVSLWRRAEGAWERLAAADVRAA